MAARTRSAVTPAPAYQARKLPIPIGLADVEDAADVRVRDLPREADLGQEPLAPDGFVGESAGQEFQCDRRPELDVIGRVDFTHPAAAERPMIR